MSSTVSPRLKTVCWKVWVAEGRSMPSTRFLWLNESVKVSTNIKPAVQSRSTVGAASLRLLMKDTTAGGCQLWPNNDIQLPNVTQSMHEVIQSLNYLTCITEYR